MNNQDIQIDLLNKVQSVERCPAISRICNDATKFNSSRKEGNIIFFFTLLLLMSCSSKEQKKEPAEKIISETVVTLTDEQLKNAALTTGDVVVKTMHTTIKVNGSVDVPPQSLVSISFPLGGYLKESHLLPGTSVQQGEILAVMEDQSYVQLQQDYLMAKARMEYLNSDVQRQKELSDADAASKKNYQLVLSEFKTQQVMIKALEEKLKIIGINPEKLSVGNISRTVSVRSPITGYVTKVNVNIGKYVNPSDVLFELVNPDDIHAAMTVFEKDIAYIHKGLKGTVSLADKADKKFEVEVILATKNISDNRTGLVHCHFENQNHDLLPGMFLTGVFDVTNQSVKAIPEEAVVRFESKEYVFVAKDAKNFEMIEVQTGTKDAGFVEIKNATAIDTKKVVVKNAYSLLGKLKNKMED
jgi:cobalt-zinc-cadmium efflux system membrane fusion protein